MWWGKNLHQLRDELDAVNQRIMNNPLSSPEIREATALVDCLEETQEKSEISAELARRGLPTLEELGLLVAKHGGGLALLNKKRLKLEKKIARAS